MDIIERYNKSLRGLEDTYVDSINRILEASFKRLLVRTKYKIKQRDKTVVRRNVNVLKDFNLLVPKYNPDKIDAYDRLFRDLANSANKKGLLIAEELTKEIKPNNLIGANIPIEATVEAAKASKGYLRKHGEVFAETSAEVVARGIAEGRPTDNIITDLRKRLDVMRYRAENIVRTEALRAYNKASDYYYAENNIDHVLYYATSDDRTCPYCITRAGLIYVRTEISVPLHPMCRCYLAPWDNENPSPEAVKAKNQHRAEVLKAAGSPDKKLLTYNLSRASVFETVAPQPID